MNETHTISLLTFPTNKEFSPKRGKSPLKECPQKEGKAHLESEVELHPHEEGTFPEKLYARIFLLVRLTKRLGDYNDQPRRDTNKQIWVKENKKFEKVAHGKK